MGEVSAAEWSLFLSGHPEAHLLQTTEWGELKAAFGWEAVRLVVGAGGAQVLFRRLPLDLSVGYVPRLLVPQEFRAPNGQIWDDGRLRRALDAICRERKAVFCMVEPDAWQGEISTTTGPGQAEARNAVQPLRTIQVDLKQDEDTILSRMKQKHRYNIRLAERKGVSVRPWDDLSAFHQMMVATGRRDGFAVHSYDYYRRAYELFHPLGMCELVVALFEDKALAALMVFARGSRAWFLYGASTDEDRNRMPTYLLQWEAMRWAKRQGCETYDLWGVPDEEEAVLEAEFGRRSGGLWGVYRFKRGFGGEVRRAASPIDLVYQRPLYMLYSRLAAGRGVAA
jgi:lipid II:glycine glycyltransferase (peptidoglycan interpeptide bridge formation enzyme)